jgi:hypothetical protein
MVQLRPRDLQEHSVPSTTLPVTVPSSDLPLASLDPQLAAALADELHRQQSTLEMTASSTSRRASPRSSTATRSPRR